MSPKQIAKAIIDHEIAGRKSAKSQYNWLQTLPAFLWSMRTAISATRGASQYELMIGKQSDSSSDLLFGQEIKKPENPDNVKDYLMQKTGRNKLAKVFAESNLHKQIQRQRQYYVENERVFQAGDLVSLFTPTNNSEVSEKLNFFWIGPWRVVCQLAPTT